MILERRRTHFYSMIALACCLTVVFVWGIIARPTSDIINQSLPPVWQSSKLAEIHTPTKTTINKKLYASINRGDFPKVLVNKLQLNVAVDPNSNNINNIPNTSVKLSVTPQSVLKFPDPLLYWQPNRNMPTEIDSSMVLLGSLPGNASNIQQQPIYYFDLPQLALSQDGALVLYSQGYNAIAGIFPFCFHNTKQPFVCQQN